MYKNYKLLVSLSTSVDRFLSQDVNTCLNDILEIAITWKNYGES